MLIDLLDKTARVHPCRRRTEWRTDWSGWWGWGALAGKGWAVWEPGRQGQRPRSAYPPTYPPTYSTTHQPRIRRPGRANQLGRTKPPGLSCLRAARAICTRSAKDSPSHRPRSCQKSSLPTKSAQRKWAGCSSGMTGRLGTKRRSLILKKSARALVALRGRSETEVGLSADVSVVVSADPSADLSADVSGDGVRGWG